MTEPFCRLDGLRMATAYTVEVATDYGADGISPPQSITVTTLNRRMRVADFIRDTSQKLGKDEGLDFYSSPLSDVPTGDPIRIRRRIFGQPRQGIAQHKTILLMGATGSGKSTLINAMINYIMGVEWEDSFRFKLIHEISGQNQAHSQTRVITAYVIHHMEGFRIPYSLTIVDTPGYGDTNGLDRDLDITANLRSFFNDPAGGIQDVDVIGFVSQATLQRLTPTQSYIFDSVLSIFGNDIKDNIQLLLTFSDVQDPLFLSIIRQANIPCPVDSLGFPEHHKFDSSGFFAANSSQEGGANVINQMYWTMGMRNFQNFFSRLNTMKTQSLTLSREVLDERKRLEVTVEGIQPQLNQGLAQMEQLRKVRRIIANNEVQIDAHDNVTFQVEVNVAKMIDISSTGHFLTNCQTCHVTCHYPCAIPKDEDKLQCWAMDKLSGCCRICPNKCHWSGHFNQTYRWEYVVEIQSSSSDELLEKYETLFNKKLTAQELLKAMEDDLENIQAQVLKHVEEAKSCIQRLEAIALRPNSSITTAEYVDLLINAEDQERKPGYQDRITSLKNVRCLADITNKICTRQNVLPIIDGHESDSGAAVQQRIIRERDPDDDETKSINKEKYEHLFT